MDNTPPLSSPPPLPPLPPLPPDGGQDLAVPPLTTWRPRVGDEVPYAFDDARPAIPARDQLFRSVWRYLTNPAITAEDGNFEQYAVIERIRDDPRRFYIVAGPPSRMLPVLARHMSKAEADIGFATCAYLNLLPKADVDPSSENEEASALESENSESDNPRARKRRKGNKAAKPVRYLPQDYDDGLDNSVPGEAVDVRAVRFFARHSYQKQTGPNKGVDTTIYGTDLNDVLAKVGLFGDFESLCYIRDFVQHIRSQGPRTSAYSWAINEAQSQNLYAPRPQAAQDLAASRQNVVNVARSAWVEVKGLTARNFHFRLVRIITLVRLHLARKFYIDVFRQVRQAAEAAPEGRVPQPRQRGRGHQTDAIEALFQEVEPNLATVFAADRQDQLYKAGLSRFKESLKAGKRYMMWAFHANLDRPHQPRMPLHNVGFGMFAFLADPRISSTWIEQGTKSSDSPGMDCTGKTVSLIWYIQTHKPRLFMWARELSPWIHAIFGHSPPQGLGEPHPIEGKSEDMLRTLADGEGLVAGVPTFFRAPNPQEQEAVYFPGFSLPNHIINPFR